MSEIYSHSRLSSFEQCPKKFQYRYVLKIPSDSESIEGFMGKRVHEVLERLYQVATQGRVPSLERVLFRFNALWKEHFDPERIRIVREENGPDLYRQLGERCLTNYYRAHYPFDADETLAIEERVTFSLDGDGRYLMQGVIDRLVCTRDDVVEIHDYKTGQRVPSQANLDKDRQLALYQIGVAERHARGRPVRLVWHYLLSNQTRSSTRSDEQIQQLRADTISVIDRIQRETAYEPRTGPLCRWCEYADRCPAGPRRPRDDDDEPALAAAPLADATGQLQLL